MTTTVTTKVLIASKRAENAQTTQYTSTNVKTIIDKFTVSNTTGSDVTFAVNLVTLADTAADGNRIFSRTILAGTTYNCPELIGQVLEAGGFISTLAGAATSLTIRASGRQIVTA